ncbi:MAG: aminotransferase class I/II-fold pyridoxal phosphate-dependent enzyme [Spirochaetia bacterium]|jgi:aspartate/methionine/tyrosine aminotransferase|nr:aminotransferase class I/II-fold pyridoxal phosphate-dependent enzyme [Spirochaetia bacterium]
MNSLAGELNSIIEGSIVDDLLSDFGRRFFFPKGIVAQSAEAKKKATRFNATVGMATSKGKPMFLNSVRDQVAELSVSDVFPYAPTPGVLELRNIWREEMEAKNPSLKGKETSVPLVTSGLTHGLSVLGDMFLNNGDTIVFPNMFWGNYRLIFEGRNQADIVTFPFFSKDGGMNISAFEKALADAPGDKVAFVLNFPNNPTGYTPSADDGDKIIEMLLKLATGGKKILAIMDDAYFGLFYEKESLKESLFGRMADLHENILAVKVDGVTKENFAWGFRIGFLTYASKNLSTEALGAITTKTSGAIRASISNSNKMAQSLVLKSFASDTYQKEKDAGFDILKERYLMVRNLVESFDLDSPLKALPFNSGYFMTFLYKGDSEKLRVHLLEEYGIGTISIQGKYLRIAYSSVELENLEELYTLIDKAAKEAL